ncbi:MAG: hypothetical protein ACHP78_14105 [Terriglobales bacterium]
MARCDLNISHLRFRGWVGDDPALNQGLEELRTKVAQQHKISGWVNHSMPKFPGYQNKIWKWDFAPEGAHSSTRKSWRLYAYVPDPKAQEPIPATAFFVHPRSKNLKGNPAKALADLLKKFLAPIELEMADMDNYRDQVDNEGRTISLCIECCCMICDPTTDIEVIVTAKTLHPTICPARKQDSN